MAVNGDLASREGELPERSITATLGLIFGVLGGVAVAFGVVLYALEPALLPLALGNLAFGVAGLIAYGITDRTSLRRAFRGRSTPLLLLEGIITLGVLAAIVVVNLLAASWKKEWDLTRDQLFTLRPQSMDVARRLDDPIEIYAFLQSSDPRVSSLEETLRLYAQHTDQLSLEVINPDRAAPELIESYELSAKSPKIVLQGPKRYTKIEEGTEAEITNALLKLLERPTRKIGYLTGHREPDPDAKRREDGFGEATAALRSEGYEVEPVGLERDLQGIEALVVVRPELELIEAELERIETFLKNGGRLVTLLEPLRTGGLEGPLAELGVDVGHNLVISPSPRARAAGFSEATGVIRDYEPHPITRPLKGQVTIFHQAQSISPILGASDVTTLIQTPQTSWAEVDPRRPPPFELDPEDEPGPIPLAVAVETDPFGRPGPRGPIRVVAFGDADFASNRMIASGANRDLFVNAVNWLLGEEDRVTIRPNERKGDRLPLTEMQHYGIMFFSVNLLPLLILGFGFSVWALRRRR
jgi:hypothetical protein